MLYCICEEKCVFNFFVVSTTFKIHYFYVMCVKIMTYLKTYLFIFSLEQECVVLR